MAITSIGGVGQMTPASQTLLRKYAGSGTARASGRKRSSGRKKKATSRARPKRKSAAGKKRRSTGSKKPARLVKGSAAAKRYMASIRKKRK